MCDGSPFLGLLPNILVLVHLRDCLSGPLLLEVMLYAVVCRSKQE